MHLALPLAGPRTLQAAFETCALVYVQPCNVQDAEAAAAC